MRGICACWRSIRLGSVVAVAVIIACASVPVKQYYLLNYVPVRTEPGLYQGPYPFVVRLKEFDIEEAYARPQVVYRQSPFELRYYFYRVWAVKPTRMITDLVHKHLRTVGLVSEITRRLDEGRPPDYELSGTIEAIEEYDSDNLWFAHLALWIRLVRLRDGKIIYNRQFDQRKRVFTNNAESFVRELSSVLDNILSQAVRDLDAVFARELGIVPSQAEVADSARSRPSFSVDSAVVHP